ncbi:hypothetical protein D3C71_1870600 [compost metagenome]
MDQRRVRKLCQQARFVDKAAQSRIEGTAVLRAHVDFIGGLATSQSGGHVFLDRNDPIKADIARSVNDAEPPFSNHVEQPVFTNMNTGL